MPLVDHRLADTVTLHDGRTVEWEATGAGPPLMWVEGGPGFWAHLARPDTELVSDLFRCHLVNTPGCGRTSRPADVREYALEPIVDFFDRVRDRLGLGRVTVMGHSWGGLVAAAWAAANPASVERLVVVDGYPGGNQGATWNATLTDAERERAWSRHAGAPWFDAAVRALDDDENGGNVGDDEEVQLTRFDPAWPLYFADPDSFAAAPHLARIRAELRWNVTMSDAWFGDDTHFDAVDILPSLGAVECPTLVIAGEHDFICGPTWNRPIAQAIPGARYVEIADAGHLPQYEQPAAFRTALMDWLATT